MCSAWASDGRKLPLAFGCDVSGRWEPYDKYHEETVVESIKVDRGGEQACKSKKEAVCNWYESRKTSGADHKFIKIY